MHIHTRHLLPRLKVGEWVNRQLKFPDRRLEMLRQRNSCLKYILEFVVGIPPTAGYSCFVKDKPEIADSPPTAGYSCFVRDKPEIAGNPPAAGYSCFVGDKPEIADSPLTAGYNCFVGGKPEIAGNPPMAGWSSVGKSL